MAVRSSNIVAARGANNYTKVCTVNLLTVRQPLLMPSEHPWAREAWTR